MSCPNCGFKSEEVSVKAIETAYVDECIKHAGSQREPTAQEVAFAIHSLIYPK